VRILRLIRQAEKTYEGTLCVVEVTPPGMDEASGLVGGLLFPLGRYVEVRLDSEEPLENARKALGRRLLEGQDFDEVIVKAQVAWVTFEMGFTQRAIQKSIEVEFGPFDLVRREIEKGFEDLECFVLRENFDWQEVTYVLDETASLSNECGPRFFDLVVNQCDLLFRGKEAGQFLPHLAGLGNKFAERREKTLPIPKTLGQDDVVNLEGIDFVGFAA